MESILWYATWPVVIYIAWKFVFININQHAKMEKLEAYEQAEKN
jgi:hypothetical protein